MALGMTMADVMLRGPTVLTGYPDDSMAETLKSINKSLGSESTEYMLRK